MKRFTIAILAVVTVSAAAGFFIAQKCVASSPAITTRANDPKLHRDWVAIVVQGGGEAWLTLRPDGTYTMRMKGEEGGKPREDKYSGTYTVSAPPAELGKLATPGQKMVDLSLAAAEASRVGMTKADLNSAGLAEAESIPFRRFLYDPTIPLLTDLLTMHMAPVGEEAEVARRMKAGANPLKPR